MGKEYSKENALIYRASREALENFSEAYGRLEAEMNRITAKQEGVKREKGDRGYKERQCRLFLKAISNLGNDDRASAGDIPGERIVDKEVFLSLVDRVVVGDELTFILRDGTKWTV